MTIAVRILSFNNCTFFSNNCQKAGNAFRAEYTYFPGLTAVKAGGTVVNLLLFSVNPNDTFNYPKEKYFLTIKNCL